MSVFAVRWQLPNGDNYSNSGDYSKTGDTSNGGNYSKGELLLPRKRFYTLFNLGRTIVKMLDEQIGD